jgi:DNA-binding Lrp family transcriptional regulator
MTVVGQAVPTSPKDIVNRAILEVSEDEIKGFVRNPMHEIAVRSGIDISIVIDRIQAMLASGVIRRVRQTLLATNLAQGALVAWKVNPQNAALGFDFIAKEDPFSGHVVIRNSEFGATDWPLWTTLKVPTGFSIEKHCDFIADMIGAEKYRIMPALRAFVLGVGHMRRKDMKVGEMADQPAMDMVPAIVDLSDNDWRVLVELKRDFTPEEIGFEMWEHRALAAGIDPVEFITVAESLDRLGSAGRSRDRSGPRDRTLSHPHPLLLARWRTGAEQREHHGRGARRDEGSGHGPQGGHRPLPPEQRHRHQLHERLLGRPRRDQAERDLAVRVSGMGVGKRTYVGPTLSRPGPLRVGPTSERTCTKRRASTSTPIRSWSSGR